MTEDERESVAFATAARSYLAAAIHAETGVASGALVVPTEMPIDFLYGHALELALKGILRLSMPSREVEGYGHNLAALYARLKEADSDLLLEIERAVRDRWRVILRQDRDEFAAMLRAAGLEANELVTNDDIGRSLADPGRIVAQFSLWHDTRNGGMRYLRVGMKTRIKLRSGRPERDLHRTTVHHLVERLIAAIDGRVLAGP